MHVLSYIVPTIGFADETLVVDEPVYINPSDVNIVTIQLVRSGDPYISLTVGIRVVPMVNNNRLAVENIDYTLDAKNVTFLPEENLTNISMTILANHDRDTDTEVVFELQPLTTGNITISQSLLKVIISNFPITGAYFPARPYIDSQSCEGCMELDGTYPFFCSVVSLVFHVIYSIYAHGIVHKFFYALLHSTTIIHTELHLVSY